MKLNCFIMCQHLERAIRFLSDFHVVLNIFGYGSDHIIINNFKILELIKVHLLLKDCCLWSLQLHVLGGLSICNVHP